MDLDYFNGASSEQPQRRFRFKRIGAGLGVIATAITWYCFAPVPRWGAGPEINLWYVIPVTRCIVFLIEKANTVFLWHIFWLVVICGPFLEWFGWGVLIDALRSRKQKNLRPRVL
jgi:hypothetical protein